MWSGIPFEFEVPFDVFLKSDAPRGKTRRIGGVISTEAPDRDKEVILQRGLDFTGFVENGWFNDNHSRKMEDVIGYPELVRAFNRGDMLPNGDRAKADGTWAEGYLLDTEKADRVWELAQSLKETNRRLGFSVEGKIHKYRSKLKKTIAQATVRNVAITHVPVNTEAKLEILTKSLMAVEASTDEQWEKALGMGTPATPGTPPTGPQTGIGAGQVLAPESLESKDNPPRLAQTTKEEDEDDEDLGDTPGAKAGKGLAREKKRKPVTLTKGARVLFSDAQAIDWYLERVPTMTPVQAARLVQLTHALKAAGQI